MTIINKSDDRTIYTLKIGAKYQLVTQNIFINEKFVYLCIAVTPGPRPDDGRATMS